MESLRGIFPQYQPPPKRDFLKENVLRIKNMQRLSKPSKNKSEYSNKYSTAAKQGVPRPRRYSVCENPVPLQRSSHSNLALCSTKAPITNLRKSLSTMSIGSREFGTQTVDPEEDEYFLKDTIIRYPSASTIRSVSAHQMQQTSSTCSRGHQMEPEQEAARPSRYKSHFSDRRDEHCDKMERHISNLKEYLDKGTINKQQHESGKKPTSILKSSSLQKLNKNSINESQQREDRGSRVASASQRSARIETVEISDDDNESQDEEEIIENKKELEASQRKERGGGDTAIDVKKQQQIKAAASDPECPDGHVPLSEDDRLDALKLAKKRKLESPRSSPLKAFYVSNFINFYFSGFKILVDELNRLPMTCETLRVRNRKIEIEKELRSLEINIRVFSRPKVYVKLE